MKFFILKFFGDFRIFPFFLRLMLSISRIGRPSIGDISQYEINKEINRKTSKYIQHFTYFFFKINRFKNLITGNLLLRNSKKNEYEIEQILNHPRNPNKKNKLKYFVR